MDRPRWRRAGARGSGAHARSLPLRFWRRRTGAARAGSLRAAGRGVDAHSLTPCRPPAMHSLVEPAVICAPLSETESRTGSSSVGCELVVERESPVEHALALERAREPHVDLDVGRLGA